MMGFIILTGTCLPFVPGAILWVSDGSPTSWSPAGPEEPWFWLTILFVMPGVLLASWTTRLFVPTGHEAQPTVNVA